jgi:cobalamin biosynthesis Mg chelatase CobN
LPTTGAGATTSSAAAAAVTPTASDGSGTADPGESVLPAVAGAPAPDAPGSGSPVGLVVGVLVVASIGGSAWWTSRRRSLR